MTMQMIEATPETAPEVADDVRKPTPDDVAESMTGFDELAVTKSFGAAVSELDGTMLMRAMAFVLHRRDGMDDKGAYLKVMQATLKAVNDLFSEKDAEVEDEGNA